MKKVEPEEKKDARNYPQIIRHYETSDGKTFQEYNDAIKHQEVLWIQEMEQARVDQLVAEFSKFYDANKKMRGQETFLSFLKEVAKTWQKIPKEEME